jgi:hypothetical protein
MARIVAIACMAVMALPVVGGLQLAAPRDGLMITLGGTAFAADMPMKAAPPPAPVGKGKAPIIGKGKGKYPVVTRG